MKHTHWQLHPDALNPLVGIDDVHQCIRNILMTQKGTDLLRPDFGCGYIDYIDLPTDIAIPHMVREITLAITEFEPRVSIEAVHITPSEHRLFVNIDWSLKEDIAREIFTTHIL